MDRTISADRVEDILSVFGSFDQNLHIIEKEFNVHIADRDEELKITGEPEDVVGAEKAVQNLLRMAAKGESIDEQKVRYILSMIRAGREDRIGELSGDVVCITSKGRPVKPKTIGQKNYVRAIAEHTVTLGIGPAGTGKTYLAVAAAVAAFREKSVNRIILTRPAVEAGERLGFLPGDLQSKVDPYLRPLYDALFDMLGPETYNNYLEKGNIEVAPLAYMRGRTLDDSFIILDEAQNTSREQMKMFLTRLGFNSKMVITGDVTQIDLPAEKTSGLKEASTEWRTSPSAASPARMWCGMRWCSRSSTPTKNTRKNRPRPTGADPRPGPGEGDRHASQDQRYPREARSGPSGDGKPGEEGRRGRPEMRGRQRAVRDRRAAYRRRRHSRHQSGAQGSGRAHGRAQLSHR